MLCLIKTQCHLKKKLLFKICFEQDIKYNKNTIVFDKHTDFVDWFHYNWLFNWFQLHLSVSLYNLF